LIVIRVLLAFVLIHAVGYLSLRALAGTRSLLQKSEILSLAFGSGTGILSVGMFYLAYLRIPLNQTNVLLFTASVVGILSFLNTNFCRRAIALRWPRHEIATARNAVRHADFERPDLAEQHRSRPLRVAEWAALVVIAFAFLLVLADAISQPLLSFDSRAIWAFKAKIIYFEQGIYGEAFLSPERLHSKTRYPQLIPLAEAFVARMAGRYDEPAFKLLFAFYFLFLVLLFYQTQQRELSRRDSLVTTAFFSALPVFLIYTNGGAASGYADLPLAYYCTALATTLVRWLREPSAATLRLAGLFGCLTMFTKAEGLALFTIAVTIVGLALLFNAHAPFRHLIRLLTVVVGSFLCLAPWFHYRARLPLVEEDFFRLLTLSNLVAGLDRLPQILRAFLRELFLKPHLWSLLGVSLTVVFFRWPRRTIDWRYGVFFWIAVLYTVVLCAIFLVTPWRLEELLPVALTRLMIHIAPLICLWICFELRKLDARPCHGMVSEKIGSNATKTE
jgi:hypothetical protein